jgi:hypothetical protein
MYLFLPFYPLRPLVPIPSTRYLLKKRKIKNTGINDNVDIANIAPKSVVDAVSANIFIARDAV